MSQVYQLTRSLGLRDATALVVGTIIGTGVFLKTAVMAQHLGSPVWILVAWGASGVLSLAGALAYAELGGMFPRAGGEYVFLREAYGPLPAFLFGWQRFWIGSPGSIAAYGVGAATFLTPLLPATLHDYRTFMGISFVGMFTALNCLTVAFGGRVQSLVTALKITMVTGLTMAIFVLPSGATLVNISAGSDGVFPGFKAMGTAMIAALWAFDGWNNLPMAAGEIKDPGRVLPRALLVGTFAALAIYMATNFAYCYALPFSDVVTSYSTKYPDSLPVASKAAISIFGPLGVSVLSLAFVLSALGAMNGSILMSARVPFAMARDRLFFRVLGNVHRTSQVPMTAILVQGAWACVLALSGTFDQLTDYVIFAAWIFYAACGSAVFVLRQKRPDAPRPFRTPGYPWVPALFILVSLWLLMNTLLTTPRESLIGLAFIAAGLPMYVFFQRRNKSVSISVGN